MIGRHVMRHPGLRFR